MKVLACTLILTFLAALSLHVFMFMLLFFVCFLGRACILKLCKLLVHCGFEQDQYMGSMAVLCKFWLLSCTYVFMHAENTRLSFWNYGISALAVGGRDSSVVRVLYLWSKGHRFESWQEGQENSFPGSTFLSISLPVTTVACKRSWSFCQKWRWQVTAKHACAPCMWLCMKWCDMVHGYMVYTKCNKMAAVSHVTSHVTNKQHCKYTT